MAKDFICGMQVNEKTAIKVTKDGKDYFFCSRQCKDKFLTSEELSEAAVCYPKTKEPLFKNKLFWVTSISVILLILSLYWPFLVPLRKSFLNYLKTIWWAVVLGLFLGGLIDHYIPREYISKILASRKPATIFNAVFLGFLMSACSHGILALSIQLHKKGASNPAVVSFLLASPWANFAVSIMLLSLFGLKGVFIILAAILVAINTGFIFMFLEKKGLIEKNKNSIEATEEFSIRQDFKKRMKNYNFSLNNLLVDAKGVLNGIISISSMILWWIILGMLIASIAGAYIPTHFFHQFMGPTLLGLLVTLALATIIEVCSEGSSPLAFELYQKTNALGNSFVFLMAGVVTDYTEIGLLWVNLGKRVALWLPVITIPQVIALGYVFNYIL
jgi:uncharacterized membrane protein YraQ (UPF0718 family)/YHS domain-containing protein